MPVVDQQTPDDAQILPVGLEDASILDPDLRLGRPEMRIETAGLFCFRVQRRHELLAAYITLERPALLGQIQRHVVERPSCFSLGVVDWLCMVYAA